MAPRSGKGFGTAISWFGRKINLNARHFLRGFYQRTDRILFPRASDRGALTGQLRGTELHIPNRPTTMHHAHIETYIRRHAHLSPRIVGAFQSTRRNLQLRYAIFHASAGPPERRGGERKRACIVFLTGFSETFLFYLKVFHEWLSDGIDVMTMDHRGQGLSDHEPSMRDAPQIAHVHTFDDYVADAVQFIDTVVANDIDDAGNGIDGITLVGHSMGGLIALRTAALCSRVRRVVLLAPMLAVHTPLHLPHACMEGLSALACYCGWSERLLWGREKYGRIDTVVDRHNPLWNKITHSNSALHSIGHTIRAFPQIAIKGPSYRWVREAAHALKRSARIDAPLLNHSHKPILIITAGQDAYVRTRDAKRFAMRHLQHASYMNIPRALHCLLLEKDAIRLPVQKHVTDFVLHARVPEGSSFPPKRVFFCTRFFMKACMYVAIAWLWLSWPNGAR